MVDAQALLAATLEALPLREEPSAPEVSVVVPMLNERSTLSELYDELEDAMNGLDLEWEVVFVDDGSTDGTYGALLELAKRESGVAAVRMRRNFGKAAALAAGIAQARGDVVVTMDSDLQDDPHEIPRLLAKLEEGYDVVSGWKEQRQDPIQRRILSRIFNMLVARATGLKLHDVNCGLKAYRAEVLEGIQLYGELHRFIPVLAHFDGFRVAEISVNHRPRRVGRSRYGLARYFRGLLDLLTVSFFGRYRHRPLHLFGGLGVATGGAGFLICAYLSVVKLQGGAIGHRPLLILGALLIIVGVQMTLMGLLAELFTRTHAESSPRAVEVADVRPAAPARSS